MLKVTVNDIGCLFVAGYIGSQLDILHNYLAAAAGILYVSYF